MLIGYIRPHLEDLHCEKQLTHLTKTHCDNDGQRGPFLRQKKNEA